jgi:hypothetical protein
LGFPFFVPLLSSLFSVSTLNYQVSFCWELGFFGDCIEWMDELIDDEGRKAVVTSQTACPV